MSGNGLNRLRLILRFDGRFKAGKWRRFLADRQKSLGPGTENLTFQPSQSDAEFLDFLSLIPDDDPNLVKCYNTGNSIP